MQLLRPSDLRTDCSNGREQARISPERRDSIDEYNAVVEEIGYNIYMTSVVIPRMLSPP